MTGWTDRWWRAPDGLRLHGRDYPAAAGESRLPVICLHGLTRNARDFEALAPALAADGRRTIAADMRGRGRSERDPARRYHVRRYARDVLALMDALGIARAWFVGTSMGGLVTFEIAGLAPARIAGAVVNDVGPVLAPAGLERILGYLGRGGAVAGWAEAAAAARAVNAYALPGYGEADWARVARRLFREEAPGRIVPDYDPAIATPAADAPAASDPWLLWHALVEAGPVLLLRGAISDLLSSEDAAAMARAGANVRLVEVPGVGHAPYLDEPAALAAIRALLADAP